MKHQKLSMGVMTNARSEMHREFIDDPEVIRYTKLSNLAQEVANDLGNTLAEAETAQQQVETYSIRLRAAYRAAYRSK